MTERASGRLNGIEAGRGVAACMVVFYHAARHVNAAHNIPALHAIFQFGHAGVDFFFVISGFIILFVHYEDIGQPQGLPHYGERRFTRVTPTYWVALAITIAMAAAGSSGLPAWSAIAWSVTLLPRDTEPILGVAWTLQYEIVFYCVFGALILQRKLGALLLALWLAGIALTAVHVFHVRWLPELILAAYNVEFFAGMAVAWWLRNNRLPGALTALAAGLVLFVLVGIGEDVGLVDGYAPVSRLFYGLPSALIVLGAGEASRSGHIVVPRWLRTLGRASYSIYLFQFVFIGTSWQIWRLSGLDGWASPVLAFAFLAVGGTVGGVLASRLIEYPLMNLVRNGLRRAWVPSVPGTP